MKRILLLSLTLLAGATMTRAQGQPDQPKSKPEKPPLTEEQRAQAEQKLNEEWNALPIQTKMHMMRLHRALSQMPPEERRFVHERIERFLNMTPEERDKLAKLREKWEKMTPDERQKAREEFRKRRDKWRQEHPGQEPSPFPHNSSEAPSKDEVPPPPPAPAPPPSGP